MSVTEARVAPPKKNGTPPAPPAEPLPDHRQKAVEQGVATFQKVVADNEELNKRLDDANRENAALRVQVESLKSIVNMMESSYKTAQAELEGRVATYQNQRDQAVAISAQWETLYVSIMNMIRGFRIPSAPVTDALREMHEAQQHIGDVDDKG